MFYVSDYTVVLWEVVSVFAQRREHFRIPNTCMAFCYKHFIFKIAAQP